MNICIISPHYPYKDNMEYVFVKRLVDEWAMMGHRCVVLSPFSLTLYFRRKHPLIPIHYSDTTTKSNPVEIYNPRYFSFPRISLFGIELNSWNVSVLIYNKLKQIGFVPDVIYCHFFISAIPGWYVSNRMRVPLFVASGESIIQKVYSPCKGFSVKRLKDDINGCICVSSKNKKEAIRMGLVSEDKCGVYPNGVDLTLFYKKDKRECRKKLGLIQNAFIVVCVGSFNERKGQRRIVEAVNRINNPRIKLVFLGSGEMTLEHESILYKGTVKNDELVNYLNASDVFCLPTLAEGCCNAIIEAMACGLPIISSDMSFNYDVLDANNAILVDPRSIESISNALQMLYASPDLCEQMSKENIMRSRALSINQRAQSILSFIEKNCVINNKV